MLLHIDTLRCSPAMFQIGFSLSISPICRDSLLSSSCVRSWNGRDQKKKTKKSDCHRERALSKDLERTVGVKMTISDRPESCLHVVNATLFLLVIFFFSIGFLRIIRILSSSNAIRRMSWSTRSSKLVCFVPSGSENLSLSIISHHRVNRVSHLSGWVDVGKNVSRWSCGVWTPPAFNDAVFF